MTNEFKFAQGQIVIAKLGTGQKVKAKVCGSHHTGLPYLGPGYIIEPLEKFAEAATYPFSHTVCFENDMHAFHEDCNH